MNKSTLFLGDLSTFCTETEIHDLFSPYGEILEIKIMRSEETNRNLSYGFIKFSNSNSAKKAMENLNGYLLSGRNLKIGWATYRSKSNAKNNPQQQHHDRIESSSVHVSYISYQLKNLVTEVSLRDLFRKYGEVIDTSIKKSDIDLNINRQCGYGFIHYPSTPEGIMSALNSVKFLNDATIDDICFKCSVSHNLEKHLNSLSNQLNNPDLSKIAQSLSSNSSPNVSLSPSPTTTSINASSNTFVGSSFSNSNSNSILSSSNSISENSNHFSLFEMNSFNNSSSAPIPMNQDNQINLSLNPSSFSSQSTSAATSFESPSSLIGNLFPKSNPAEDNFPSSGIESFISHLEIDNLDNNSLRFFDSKSKQSSIYNDPFSSNTSISSFSSNSNPISSTSSPNSSFEVSKLNYSGVNPSSPNSYFSSNSMFTQNNNNNSLFGSHFSHSPFNNNNNNNMMINPSSQKINPIISDNSNNYYSSNNVLFSSHAQHHQFQPHHMQHHQQQQQLQQQNRSTFFGQNQNFPMNHQHFDLSYGQYSNSTNNDFSRFPITFNS